MLCSHVLLVVCFRFLAFVPHEDERLDNRVVRVSGPDEM